MASARIRANEKKLTMMSKAELKSYMDGEQGKKRAKAKKEAQKRGLDLT